MNKLYAVLGMTVSSLIIATPSFANSCMPIAQACMKQGYYKGGHDTGKGLIEDCVMPVVRKEKTLPNESFTDEALSQCDATIQKKMEQKMPQQTAE